LEPETASGGLGFQKAGDIPPAVGASFEEYLGPLDDDLLDPLDRIGSLQQDVHQAARDPDAGNSDDRAAVRAGNDDIVKQRARRKRFNPADRDAALHVLGSKVPYRVWKAL
jgi:hypothetical protein